MKSFLKRSIITGAAVILAVYVVPGIAYKTPESLILATLLLVILNSFIRPIMLVLALPLLIFTLGLFVLVINALLLYWVGHILQLNFTVDTFGAVAFWGRSLSGIASSDSQLAHQKRGFPNPVHPRQTAAPPPKR